MAVEQPELEWRDGAPVSTRFGDSYFSRQGGLDESRAVFLAGCGLPGAWAGRALFRVGELGFGSGLNALALWDLWRRTRPAGGRLVLLSIEGFPLSLEDAARAHAAFPEIADLSARLRDRWPAAAPGAHLMDFPEDGFAIGVVHGAVAEALDQVEGSFDAWFLDGFAPAQNPDMWSPALMARLAALSAPGARAATFTVAGAVRRGLAAAGFAVEKKPGFGRKRERLEARLETPPPRPAPDPLARGAARDGDVLILGGGIAGCALAHALGARGRRATIVSAGPMASAPPAALLTPRLEAADRPHARALFAAFLHAAALYGRLGGFVARGAVRLGGPGDAARFRALADLWPGLEAEGDCLRIAAAGALDPARILPALAGAAPRVTAQVADIGHADGAWRLTDAAGREIACAPILVLAGGAAGAGAALLAPLGLGFSGGQVSLHPAGRAGAEAATWGGFAAPTPQGVLIGATHDRLADAAPPPPDAARARDLAEAAAARLPDWEIDPAPQAIWTGVRATTADRLPCAGPVPDAARFAALWAAAARNGRVTDEDGAAGLLPGLYALTGFGSRGYAHAPLLAQALAADLCGEPGMLADARRALHPARFLWRAMKRG